MLTLLSDFIYKKEMRTIRNKLNLMMNASDIENWADRLYNSMATFDDNLVCFHQENLFSLFKDTYENKECIFTYLYNHNEKILLNVYLFTFQHIYN